MNGIEIDDSPKFQSPFFESLNIAGQIFWWLIFYSQIGEMSMAIKSNPYDKMDITLEYRWSLVVRGKVYSFNKHINLFELTRYSIMDYSVVAESIFKKWNKEKSLILEEEKNG